MLVATSRRHLHRAAHEFEQPLGDRPVQVPARTLGSVLTEAAAPHDFDLLSLDVEGYEAQVLRGLDLQTWRPRFICIEVRDRGAVGPLLAKHYDEIAVLHQEADYEDILFRRR